MLDVVIFGAGPAGLFAARELAENTDLSIKVFERGRDIHERNCPATMTGECGVCDPCDVMQGLGGTGGMSDGTLNLSPKIGGDLTEFVDRDEAYDLIEEVDSTFLEFGASERIYGNKTPKTEKLARKAAAAD